MEQIVIHPPVLFQSLQCIFNLRRWTGHNRQTIAHREHKQERKTHTRRIVLIGKWTNYFIADTQSVLQLLHSCDMTHYTYLEMLLH